MAPAKQGTKPVVALVANLCCLGILGYVLIGQATKGVFVVITTIVLSIVLVGVVVGICGLIDVYQCAEALEKGEEIDENEYKFELLYKIMKIVHKDAIYKGDAA